MTPGKRIFDMLCASAVLVLVLPVMAWISYRIWREDDGPILYVAERMRSPAEGFGLLKFRTMTHSGQQDAGVTGGDKSGRITPLGAWLRRRRLDELPQLINIIKGDMSFVGPRPPLREYVERC
jgi:lipopolysaccharide/colanic/teichoic acid biosynthesis glycosyltransferase